MIRLAVALMGVCAMLFLTADASTSTSKDIVVQFVDAYNERDVEKMLALCAENVRWLTVTGDSVIVETEGKAMLGTQMHAHFERGPITRSALVEVAGNGPMVVAIEKATTGTGTTARSQCSASVYKVAGGLIKDVWYFDAHKCANREPN